jgi:hypothetical protein
LIRAIDLAPDEKRAVQRRILREVLTREGLRSLPRRRAVLLTGSQGSGKTTEALAAVAELRGDMIIWCMQPTTDKAEEVAGDYATIASPESLPVLFVRGRSADDPRHPEQKMCPPHVVVHEAAKKGIPIRRAICSTCPRKTDCGYMRQDAEILGLGDRAYFLLSLQYLFLPCPAPGPDLLIADKSVVIGATETIEFPINAIEAVLH